MSKPKITEITAKIVDLLTPLESIERQRVMQASFTLLGEDQGQVGQSAAKNLQNESDNDKGNLSAQAKTWMRQNGVTAEMLEEVFHVEDGKVDVIIADMPGKDVKAKTINAYIIKGIGNFLVTGDASFDDKAARELCKRAGCYSDANHAAYIKDGLGNKVTGSKNSGWKLTAPGLKYGADVIKSPISV